MRQIRRGRPGGGGAHQAGSRYNANLGKLPFAQAYRPAPPIGKLDVTFSTHRWRYRSRRFAGGADDRAAPLSDRHYRSGK